MDMVHHVDRRVITPESHPCIIVFNQPSSDFITSGLLVASSKNFKACIRIRAVYSRSHRSHNTISVRGCAMADGYAHDHDDRSRDMETCDDMTADARCGHLAHKRLDISNISSVA